MSVAAALFLGVTLAASGAHAQWAVVGAACSPDGIMANSNGFLTCTGGVWVANPIRAGNLSTCNSGNAGYIRWSGSAFEGCNGTSWIQLAGGSGLKVYKADGVTELGNLVGTAAPGSNPCEGLVYAEDDSGDLHMLSAQDCTVLGNVNTYALFSGSNCTGAVYGNGTVWGCTGAAVCQTDKSSYQAGTGATRSYASRRDLSGVCENITGSTGTYTTYTPFCQGQYCRVK